MDHIFKKKKKKTGGKTSTVVEKCENRRNNIKSHFRTDGHIKGFYVYPIKPVCQRHYADVVSHPVHSLCNDRSVYHISWLKHFH